MSMDPGNADCTTGLSKALYDALTGDARMPFPPSMTDAQKAVPRAVCYAVASKVAAEANADRLPVHAAYTSASGQSIPKDTDAVINFATREEDTHNAVATGAAWRFTCPTGKGGRYLVTAGCTFDSALSDSAVAYLAIRVNGTARRRVARIAGSAMQQEELSGSTVLSLSAGHYVDVALFHKSEHSGGEPLETMAVGNFITITRLSD